MKNSNEHGIEEIRTILKRMQSKNQVRTVLFIGVGIAIVLLSIIFAVLKFKEKWFFEDEEDCFDYPDEDYVDLSKEDDNTEEEYKDFYALDYEEE